MERRYDAHIAQALSLVAERRAYVSEHPDARSSAEEWPPGTRLRPTPPPPDRAASRPRLTPAPGAPPLAGAVPTPGMAAAGAGVWAVPAPGKAAAGAGTSWPRTLPPGPPPGAAPEVPPGPLWEQSLRQPWNCPQPGPRPRPALPPGGSGPPRHGPAKAPGLPVTACPYGDVRQRDRGHGRPRSPGRSPGPAGKGTARPTLGRASSRRPSGPPVKAPPGSQEPRGPPPGTWRPALGSAPPVMRPPTGPPPPEAGGPVPQAEGGEAAPRVEPWPAPPTGPPLTQQELHFEHRHFGEADPVGTCWLEKVNAWVHRVIQPQQREHRLRWTTVQDSAGWRATVSLHPREAPLTEPWERVVQWKGGPRRTKKEAKEEACRALLVSLYQAGRVPGLRPPPSEASSSGAPPGLPPPPGASGARPDLPAAKRPAPATVVPVANPDLPIPVLNRGFNESSI